MKRQQMPSGISRIANSTQKKAMRKQSYREVMNSKQKLQDAKHVTNFPAKAAPQTKTQGPDMKRQHAIGYISYPPTPGREML